jgi:ATP/maltotriose-dependent transcriptional regulator MalT
LLDACVEDLEARQVIRRTASVSRDAPLMSALGERPFPSRTRATLSNRELEVLGLAAQGFRNKEIAGRLFISEKTVKTHLQNTYEKLGAHSRTEAVMKAKEAGLLR